MGTALCGRAARVVTAAGGGRRHHCPRLAVARWRRRPVTRAAPGTAPQAVRVGDAAPWGGGPPRRVGVTRGGARRRRRWWRCRTRLRGGDGRSVARAPLLPRRVGPRRAGGGGSIGCAAGRREEAGGRDGDAAASTLLFWGGVAGEGACRRGKHSWRKRACTAAARVSVGRVGQRAVGDEAPVRGGRPCRRAGHADATAAPR